MILVWSSQRRCHNLSKYPYHHVLDLDGSSFSISNSFPDDFSFPLPNISRKLTCTWSCSTSASKCWSTFLTALSTKSWPRCWQIETLWKEKHGSCLIAPSLMKLTSHWLAWKRKTGGVSCTYPSFNQRAGTLKVDFCIKHWAHLELCTINELRPNALTDAWP